MNSTRNCQGCDHSLEGDDRFCSHCGAPAVDAGNATLALALPPARFALPEGSALGSLDAVLREDHSDEGRLTLAAFERLCEGEVDDALLAAESAVHMNPRLWSAHLIAGVARNQRGETETAEAHLQDAVQAEPMAIHHKASLERLLAAHSPRRIAFTPLAALSQLSPIGWTLLVGVPVLVVLLIAVIVTSRRPNEFDRSRLRYTASNPTPANSSPLAPAAGNTPYSAPFSSSANPAPAPYSPPTYRPAPTYSSPYTANRPSAPPPITYDDEPSGSTHVSSVSSGPGALPRAGERDSFQPLAPAQPNFGNVPELKDRNLSLQVQRPEGNARVADRGGVPQNTTPWAKPESPRNPMAASIQVDGRTGRARVGNEPIPSSSTRANLPPPSDAVTSTSRIAPAPVPRSIPRSASEERSESQPAEAQANGRDLQNQARRLQRQGKWDEAASAYRGAIAAYQEDINNGRNPRAAEYGIAASRAALDLVETQH